MLCDSYRSLKYYCENNHYKGYDPYDGLNSKLFQSLPIKNNKLCRLVWIQLFKRLPFNLRTLVGIKKDYNPKGLGLFLNGYCNLYYQDAESLKALDLSHTEIKEKIVFLSNTIIDLISPDWSGACWGYNFDWQARAFFQPKGTPTVVASTFIAYALMDAYDILKDKKLLDVAVSVKDFVLNDLNRTYDNNGNFAFSYSPLDKTQVFNASLLGSRLLARVYSYIGDKDLLVEAKRSVQFCVDHQREDGSWGYGTLPFHQWVDNFHTGYNLECISEYQKYSRDTCYADHIEKGFEYYINTFFTEKGIAKYYNNSVFPIDIHAPAQLIVTLSKLDMLEENKALADKVLNWTISNMQDKKGYFYFQKKKYFTSKIPYIRWAQAWMFYAMSIRLRENV